MDYDNYKNSCINSRRDKLKYVNNYLKYLKFPI